MEIRIIKGQGNDRIEGRRRDGSRFISSLPRKGPVPHDMVHFVVEHELGFQRGFWGLVAAGSDPDRIAEQAKAAGHASAKRAERPEAHFVEAIQVERLVECFEAELWSSGSDNESLRAMARAGCDQSLVPCPSLPDEAIERARTRLAGLASRWAATESGGSLTLEWEERQAAA